MRSRGTPSRMAKQSASPCCSRSRSASRTSSSTTSPSSAASSTPSASAAPQAARRPERQRRRRHARGLLRPRPRREQAGPLPRLRLQALRSRRRRHDLAARPEDVREDEPHPAAGESFSTLRQPIQGFQWADYSAKPGTTYTYTVVALYGDPADLKQRITVEIEITTESEVGAVHSAFFNRGSVATQEYARRFQNRPPNIAGPGAYEWLSRGLLEAFVAFLGRAGPGWEVHGACYEFQWPDALAAVRQAHQRGAKVHVLFDDMGPSKANRAAIKAAKIRALCRGRVHGKLMHNKFFVLSRNGAPQAVWTGSTNLTENGIFGHANVGHVVEDVTIAQAFRDYCDRLAADSPVAAPYRSANEQASPAPHPWKSVTTAVFSPRGAELDALQWCADIA